MYDVMEGVRVVEVAEHTFAPAAGMMLADWGADVIKVERSVGGGDPARNLAILQRPGQKLNAYFEVANRGKRSIGLDLRRPEGRAILYQLVENADVFITNLRADARTKLGIEAAELMALNPKLIYARATGYGTQGPMANDGGFDYPSSWCRSGSAFVQTPANGDPPPLQPGSVGDLTGGATICGAISAALFRRERTGKGCVVDHSLYGMGAYIMTQSICGASLAGTASMPAREVPPGAANAMNRHYLTRDGRWIQICFLFDVWFPDFARRLGREDLLADPRFKDEPSKYANGVALAAELDKTFATRDYEDWKKILAGADGVWAPVQSPGEVLTDVQAIENGIVTPVQTYDGGTYWAAQSPGKFDERPVGELRASPAFGQHTDEVARQLGFTDAQIAAMREEKLLV
jgi:crotonobetainyl-CoA:carnitine CoA-transferase CaiB-like acyl-CoA transferase